MEVNLANRKTAEYKPIPGDHGRRNGATGQARDSEAGLAGPVLRSGTGRDLPGRLDQRVTEELDLTRQETPPARNSLGDSLWGGSVVPEFELPEEENGDQQNVTLAKTGIPIPNSSTANASSGAHLRVASGEGINDRATSGDNHRAAGLDKDDSNNHRLQSVHVVPAVLPERTKLADISGKVQINAPPPTETAPAHAPVPAGVLVDSGLGSVGVRAAGGESDCKAEVVQPVAKAKLQVKMQPVAKGRKPKNADRLRPPHVPGHAWRPDGLSGWDLWRRTPTVSENGKPSSKHKYIAYYSRADVQRKIDEVAKAKKTAKS